MVTLKKKIIEEHKVLNTVERQSHVHGLEDSVYKDFGSPQILLINKYDYSQKPTFKRRI